jgi:hypothetical protein
MIERSKPGSVRKWPDSGPKPQRSPFCRIIGRKLSAMSVRNGPDRHRLRDWDARRLHQSC